MSELDDAVALRIANRERETACLCENNSDYCPLCARQVDRGRPGQLDALTAMVETIFTEHGIEPVDEYARRTR